MSNWRKLLCASLVTIAVAGCEGTEDLNIAGLLNVRVLHASPDAPRLNVTVEGPVGTLEILGRDYKQGSGNVAVRFGKTTVRADAVLPDGTTSNVFEATDADITWAEDTNYDFIVLGNYADPLSVLSFENAQSAITSGMFRAQVAHAAPGIENMIRVYVTAPGDILDMSTPFVSATYNVDPDSPAEYSVGDTQFRVALLSDPLVPIFDSGTTSVVAGADLLIVAVDNTTTSTAPITLVVQDGVTTVDLADVGTLADMRFVHAMPDEPDVDVIIDEAPPPPAVSGLAFGAFTDYLVPGLTANESHNIEFVETGSVPPPLLETDRTLAAGLAFTLLAAGLEPSQPLVSVLFTDNNRRIATEAKFRIIHMSNVSGAVDVYVADTGQPISPDNLRFVGLPIGLATGYLSLAAGNYDVTLTVTGDETDVILTALMVTVADGGVYTAVMVDSATGVAPVGFVFMDDFVP